MKYTEIAGWVRLSRDMGLRYCIFRVWYYVQRQSGILRLRFPARTMRRSFINLDIWQHASIPFFFNGKHLLLTPDPTKTALKEKHCRILSGEFPYFNAMWHRSPGWHTHPLNGYTFDPELHWTKIPDFSLQQGDIKMVWEKSRFTFLYDLIRYDYHFQEDQSGLVLELITDWITQNPVNRGPNWMCSQEISLRVLNWTFALFYYRHSTALSQLVLDKVLASIYDQMRHVRDNISFSRIAVRNNHTLTETAALFITGMLFPFFEEAEEWKTAGKKLFEQEIAFQIDVDGAYIQHSANYYRIVIQLLNWVLRLAALHTEVLSPQTCRKARQAFRFLEHMQDPVSGWLPNYGPNDGALFFPLTDCHYRNYRPQLGTLAAILELKCSYPENTGWEEEAHWLGLQPARHPARLSSMLVTPHFLAVKNENTLTCMHSMQYRHRPHQADNLHLDVWVNGKNILRDGGTYSYHAPEHEVKYFAGTASHNTVIIGGLNQMQKKSRFIWLHWIKNAGVKISTENDCPVLQGWYEGFRESGDWIKHHRKVTIMQPGRLYMVEDTIEHGPPDFILEQIWNPGEGFAGDFQLECFDQNEAPVPLCHMSGWYSGTYGRKVPAERIIFRTAGGFLKTYIIHNTIKHAHTADPPILFAGR
ncbi:heparinase II/III domain-containing protein [Dyadobacter sandarakinus]|uniref:Alginate lyase family protein n=1 Tax=Dyadobacter sandarakinus TaxID=2747268 RepID=A0ABX7IAC7_9BACT|nr:heparinase II/III family protein [Dyadobacter sandarakinus]QRR02768.1 alginate lyase family protein [Dyadobacter sandarakinus]